MSSGILRQYIEDFAARAGEYDAKAQAYNKTIAKSGDNPVLYKHNGRSENMVKDAEGNPVYAKGPEGENIPTYLESYTPLEKRGDSWYANGGPVDMDGSSLTQLDDNPGFYMQRQNGQTKADGSTYYPTNPGEFKEKAPEFTFAQTKQLMMPDRSQILAGAARGSEGVIARFLQRKQESD